MCSSDLKTDFGTYRQEQYFDDMGTVTEYRCDPDLVEILVIRSRETLLWMRSMGVRFQPMWGQQAFEVDGRFTFWGGLAIETMGGGPGLVDALSAAALKAGIDISYGARAVSLIADEDRKSTRLNSSPVVTSDAVFCLQQKKKKTTVRTVTTLPTPDRD